MASLQTDKSDIGSQAAASPPSDRELAELEKEISNSGEFPDGGLRAWLVACGASASFFCTLGFTNSFGVFQAYYQFHQMPNEPVDNIAWIGGIQAFLIFAVGSIAGPLFDRYGAWVIRPAAVLYIFGIMMTSICKEFWQFMLAQGIVTGVGNGLVMFPAFAAVPQWFDKKRGAAMGISIAGSSIGAIFFPIILSRLLTKTDIGFGWSVRIAGFVMLPFLVFASFAVRTRLPPRKTQFLLAEPFKKPLYVLLVIALFFSMVGMFVPMFLIPTYAITKGMNETLASYLIAMLNGASIFGRVIPGVLGDKFGRLNTLIAATLATGVIVFAWPFAESNGAIIGVTIVFGFWSGAIISGGSVAFTIATDNPKNLGTYIGIGMALASFSALLGPPVSGALVDRYASFNQASYFSGSLTLFGSVMAIAAKYFAPKGIFGQT